MSDKKTGMANGRVVPAVGEYVADILLSEGKTGTISCTLNVTDAEFRDACAAKWRTCFYEVL